MSRLGTESRRFVVSLALLALPFATASAAPVLFELNASDVPAMHEAILALRAEGARPLHVFPPNHVIAELGEASESRLRERGVVRALFADPLGDSEIDAKSTLDRIAHSAFRRLRTAPAPAPIDPMHPLPGIPTCGLPLPDALGKTADLDSCTTTTPNLPFGADCNDLSEFFIGSVAVGVFLLESAGSAYDWTPAEITETTDGVVAGMDHWIALG